MNSSSNQIPFCQSLLLDRLTTTDTHVPAPLIMGCHAGCAWAIVSLILASGLQCSAESTAYTPERLRREFRLAVCVVGQVARTEVQSKIENLVMPNTYLSSMHMFLVLQTGQARFTNKASEAQCMAAPGSLEEATASFNSYVPTTASEYEFTQYDVNEWQFPGYPDSAAAKKTRLTNHINQWITWRKCSKMVEQHELETGQTFHAVLRIRDNAIVLEPFDVLERLLQLQDELHRQYPKTYRRASLQAGPGDIRNLPVVTKACSSWRGVADKVCLLLLLLLLLLPVSSSAAAAASVVASAKRGGEGCTGLYNSIIAPS